MEKMIRTKWRDKDTELHAIFKITTFPAHWHVHQCRSSPNLIVRTFFIEALLCRYDWLNHWPYDWTQSLGPHPSSVVGGEAESSNPLIMCEANSFLETILRSTMSHLVIKNSVIFMNSKRYSYHSRNSKGFSALCQKPWTKTIYVCKYYRFKSRLLIH